MHSIALSRRCFPHVNSSTCLMSNRVKSVSKLYLLPAVVRHHSISRLSNFWIPTGGIEPSRDSQDESHALLVRAGYVRQAHAGVFHMLPLGHRVLQKLETLIDKHMASLGASKVSLSSISSEDLWRKTGRFVGHGGELFAFQDRKENKYLLAPTHEEEITSLVASSVQSYKDLPLRLYQTSRKYRDEARPRQGLLRGREFIMKDLYTFDHTEQEARQTYELVQTAYKAFFDELKLPYLVARADSGNMGGNLSHEYHFVSPKGEDNVISCGDCGNTINDELAMTKAETTTFEARDVQLQHWCGIGKDKTTLVVAWFPRTAHREGQEPVTNQVNLNVIKALAPDIDLSVEDPLDAWKKANTTAAHGQEAQIVNILDGRLPADNETIQHHQSKFREQLPQQTTDNAYKSTEIRAQIDGEPMQLTSTLPGDKCSECGTGQVAIHRAVEMGHTFYLGTRYSKPLEATVVNKDDQRVTIQMGCHGIGVSRLVGTIASILADSKGLNWPASIAPYQAVIVPGKGNDEDAEKLYEALYGSAHDGAKPKNRERLDLVLDDRNKAMGWKLNDADLVGYPLIIVLGRSWKKERKVEVQCRRLGVKEEVHESNLAATIAKLLGQL